MADTYTASPTDAVGRFRVGDAANATADVAITPGGVPNAIEVNVEALRDNQLDVRDLVRMFEESEESTYTARQESERDRDYVDNKQLTAEELATLKKRGQPPQIDNRIKTKIDYLIGLEKQQRIDPKALPRTPVHEDDADGATQALRYVADTEDFDSKRSDVWRNMLVEGAGGISVAVRPAKASMGQVGTSPFGQTFEIELRRIAWDRMFWDPHSSAADYSDANYLGVVVWMDYNDAVLQYGDEPGAIEALDNTLHSAPSQTYDDKPKWSLWADKKRKRVRIVQIWIKRGEEWHFAEFTKGGILKAGPSPYRTDTGESDCELFFQSSYVDRDNNRYGLVREMITLQDGINKRHSKALHLLNTVQGVALAGAVDDVEKARREAMRPDGWIEVNQVAPGGGLNDNIRFETRMDLATAQLQLLQEAKNSIDLKGPNATQMGDKAQGSSSASGRAILASQQGGMVSLGDLLDNLRHLDRRVFRAIWARIRQFWTEEKWIRVTDDEQNLKWVGMNVDPMRIQQIQMMAQQNPQVAQKVGGIVPSVAQLDCDIIIDEVPDTILANEQFNALVQLKQFDTQNQIPFRAIVQASSIKNKSQILSEMDKAAQQPPPPPPEIMKAQLEAQVAQQKAQSDAQLQAQKLQTDAVLEQQKSEQEALRKHQQLAAELQLQLDKAQAQLEIEQTKASAQIEIQRQKAAHDAQIAQQQAAVDVNLAINKREHDNRLKEADRQEKARTEKVQTETVTQQYKTGEMKVQGDTAVASALSELAKGQAAIAKALEKTTKPKVVWKQADGSYRAEVA